MEIIENDKTIDNAHSVSDLMTEGQSQKAESDIYKGETPIAANDSKIEPPLSIYEQIKGVPYTIIHFDLNSVLFSEKAMLHDGQTMRMARAVDDFVLSEIEEKNLIDSPSAYVDIVNKLKSMLNIDPLEKNNSVLKKIYAFTKRYRGMSAYTNKDITT
ncbi:MAG: hypothetical protein KAU20_07605 [Nanoarchaeota archaeon]|nr:hypothetical protein [Nanoarchaeota archaeon]